LGIPWAEGWATLALVALSETRQHVVLVGADDAAWEEWLSPVRRDIYHTAGYHLFARESGEGEPCLAVVGDGRRGFAWPYLLRRIEGIDGVPDSEASDVTSVYGYPGPLAWGCEPGDSFIANAWDSIVDLWREQGVVSAFTRFNPLLDNAALLRGERFGSDGPARHDDGVTVAGSTVSVDLTVGEEVTRSRYGHDLRRRIDATRRTGLATIHDEGWIHLSAFASMYRETMDRNVASDYYYFDEDDFRRLRAALVGQLHLLVTLVDDSVAAAGLFTEFGGIAQMHLAASSEAWLHRSPIKVLVDDAIRWARSRGNLVLHLGGGRGGQEDSLYWFKSRFSPRRHDFQIGRWIIDRRRYDAFTDARLATGGPRELQDAEYFPLYRAQTPSREDRP